MTTTKTRPDYRMFRGTPQAGRYVSRRNWTNANEAWERLQSLDLPNYTLSVEELADPISAVYFIEAIEK